MDKYDGGQITPRVTFHNHHQMMLDMRRVPRTTRPTHTSLSSKRFKQNTYYLRFIKPPASQNRARRTPKKYFIPYDKCLQPTIEERFEQYMEKLSDEEYIKSDPIL